MNGLLSVLSLAGPLSLAVALTVMALLSQRLGAVTRRPKAYRIIFLSAILIGIAIVLRLSFSISGSGAEMFDMILYSTLVAVALTASVFILWRYWGWLLSERTADHETNPAKGPGRDH